MYTVIIYTILKRLLILGEKSKHAVIEGQRRGGAAESFGNHVESEANKMTVCVSEWNNESLPLPRVLKGLKMQTVH